MHVQAVVGVRSELRRRRSRTVIWGIETGDVEPKLWGPYLLCKV